MIFILVFPAISPLLSAKHIYVIPDGIIFTEKEGNGKR